MNTYDTDVKDLTCSCEDWKQIISGCYKYGISFF